MFKIKLADLVILVNNRYRYVYNHCKSYICKDENYDFSIEAGLDEIEEEYRKNKGMGRGYCEDLCIYRNIGRKLPLEEGLVVHGTAVEKDNEVYLFLAKSGVGKTTHAHLWLDAFGKNARILNGDKPVIKRTDGIWQVFGTPWQGKEDEGYNGALPLKAVCFLQRGKENSIRRICREEIEQKLFNQLLIPREEEPLKKLLYLVENLMQEIPFYNIECLPNQEAAVLAYENMK